MEIDALPGCRDEGLRGAGPAALVGCCDDEEGMAGHRNEGLTPLRMPLDEIELDRKGDRLALENADPGPALRPEIERPALMILSGRPETSRTSPKGAKLSAVNGFAMME